MASTHSPGGGRPSPSRAACFRLVRHPACQTPKRGQLFGLNRLPHRLRQFGRAYLSTRFELPACRWMRSVITECRRAIVRDDRITQLRARHHQNARGVARGQMGAP